jgi:hypothetical protein
VYGTEAAKQQCPKKDLEAVSVGAKKNISVRYIQSVGIFQHTIFKLIRIFQ